MKIPTLLLVLSVVANGILAYAWVQRRALLAPPNSSSAAASHGESSSLPVAPGGSEASATAKADATRRLWDRLRTQDLAEVAKELRAAGFPRDAVNAIVSEIAYSGDGQQEGRERAARIRALPYWRSEESLRPKRSREESEAASKAAIAHMTKLEEVLGPDWYVSESALSSRRERRVGKLPPEKAEALAKLESDYREIELRRITEAGGARDAAMSKLLMKEFRADVEKLLTKEELLELDLRSSPGAELLRHETRLFQPSEAEYRALYPLYAANGGFTTPTGDDFEAKAREILGEERYNEFAQSRDRESDRLNRLVLRLNLPLTAAYNVAQTRRDALARSDAIRADPALTPAQKQARMAEIARATMDRISTVLGSRGYTVYEKHDGHWLKLLE